MQWILVLYVFTGTASGDPGIFPGYVRATTRAEVVMPDRETCQAIVKLNINENGECWARVIEDKKP